MRRLLYCLLGSALFHAALLWVPLPMNAGSAVEDAPLLVRVRLVAAPGSDAEEQPSRPQHRGGRRERAQPAQTEPSRAVEEPRRAVENTTRSADMETVRAVPKMPHTVRETSHLTPEPERERAVRETRRAVPDTGRAVAEAGAAARQAGSGDPTGKPGRATGGAWKQPDGENTAWDAADDPLPTAATGSDRVGDGAGGVARAAPAAPVTAGAAFSPVRYARTVKPRYPGKARRAGWEGTTLLRVLVDPNGAPGRVTVERTSGFDILDEAAVKAVRRWRFHPARRGVAPLASWVRIPVVFELQQDRR